MARLMKYIAYIVLSACIGFSTFVYYFVVWLFSSGMIFGTLDSPPLENTLPASIFVVMVFPILFGVSAFGCYYVIKIFFESFNIQLSLKFGVVTSSIAALYIMICFLPFIFPKLHIPFALF